MNIIGANLDGKFIDVDAKGLLTVASVQNTSHSKNSSFGVNVNQSNAASMNGSRGNSDRTFTDNLTTILGTEGVRIHSDTGTVVEGALIANATRNQDGTLTDHGNLTVETPFLSWKDLEDIDVSKQIGGGINVSGDDGRSTSGTKTFSEIWDDTANADYRKDETIGVTKATIGNGTINITNPSAQSQDLATLNRDINNVQIITKESETHISITVPVPDSIANPIGNAGGAVANGIVKAVEITVPATVEAIRNLTTSVTDKLVSDGKITADDKANIDALAADLKAGEISKEDLSGCLGGGTAFNLKNFLISPAYAAGCTVTVNGVQQELDRDKVELSVYLAEQEAKAIALARPEMATEYEFDVCLSDPACAEKMEMRAEATMTAMTAGEGAVLLKGVSQAVRLEGLAAITNMAKSALDDLGGMVSRWFTRGADDLPPLRQSYIDDVIALETKGDQLLKSGLSYEDTAKILSADRRALGVTYKAETPEPLLKTIYDRNLTKYGDELGPSFEQLVKQAQDKGLTGNDVYKAVIKSASRPGGADLGLGMK